jgi:hypothetical protein
MEKEKLIESAARLNRPSEASVSAFREKSEQMAAAMNRIMGGRSDLLQLVGHGNLAMMEDNHRNHARFMASFLGDFQPPVLVETVLWVFRAYRSHGFNLTYWPAQLDHWVEVLREHLSPSAFDEVYPVYHWMIIHQPDFASLSDKMIDTGQVPGHD